MAEEIDINKLHGIIKQYALSCEQDSKGSKGYGKLNTAHEINLFKDMVRRNGKEAELKKQLPNIKGITIPTKEKELNKHIIDLMKKDNSEDNQKELKNTVSKKIG